MTVSIRTILVPIAFDPPSARALEWALELAVVHRSSVHLVHVVDLPTVAPPEAIGLAAPEILGEVQHTANDELARIVAEHGDRGVALRHSLRFGAPALEIVSLAKDLPADLIVIGTHARRGLGHVLLGSVAEKVVRTAEVPVLTVGPHEAKRAA